MIRRVLREERGALGDLAARLECVPQILRACNSKHGHSMRPEELDDLTQDVLLVVWRKIHSFHGLSALEAWVYRICLLEYLTSLRRKARGARQKPLTTPEGGSVEPEPARNVDPWEFEDVHESLRRIGGPEAQVIRMKHFEGLTFAEIGERLGASPNTIKARYYRGIEELRPLLETRNPQPSSQPSSPSS